MGYHSIKVEKYIERVKTYVDSATLKTLRDQYAPGDLYQVSRDEQYYHEPGSGGRRKLTAQLLQGDQPLILSICKYFWYTDSDDSTDHLAGKTSRTYLLHNDPVAKLIFDRIRAGVQQT